jgi:hypothetical protein
MTTNHDLIEQLRQCGETRSADGRGSRICDEAADLIERVIGDLPQDAIDGGWTALGMSRYAKGLETQIETLQREREAILQQARIWALEARTQKSTVDEVGSILGGIPDWGPIAAGVEALKADAERYRYLRAGCFETTEEAYFQSVVCATPKPNDAHNYAATADLLDAACDAAIKSGSEV